MQDLKKILIKNSWVSILISIVIAGIGIALINNPTEVSKIAIYVLGGVFIGIGGLKVFKCLIQKAKENVYNNDVIYGGLLVIIGILIILCTQALLEVFRVVIGLWIIYKAIVTAVYAVDLKKAGLKVWYASITMAIVMCILGLYITCNAGAVLNIVGAIILIYAIMDIVDTLIYMINLKKFDDIK